MERLQIATNQHLIHLASSSSSLVLEPDQSLSQIVTSNDQVIYSTIAAGSRPILARSQLPVKIDGERYLSTVRPGSSNPFLLYLKPISSSSDEIAIVGSSTDKVVDTLDVAKDILIIGGICAVIFASLGAGLLASVVLKPVERMRRQAQDLSNDHSPERLDDPGTGDELAALADTLNSFLIKIEEASQIQRRFIASASHELRTPLAGMRAELDSRWSESPESESEVLLDRIDKRVDRLIYITEGLLKVAQGQNSVIPLELSWCDLEQVVSTSLLSLSHYSKAAQVALVLDVKEAVTCLADSLRISEIVENLTANAIRHSKPGDAVEISLSSEGGNAIIGIRDHGEGFDPALVDQVFEPFVSSGSTNFGLGLSVVKYLVLAHRGSVTVGNHQDGGAHVVVNLPISSADSP